MSSACVNDTEPLDFIVMDLIILLILSLSSFSVLQLRDATALPNCNELNYFPLEVSSCSCGMMNFADTILSTPSDTRAVKQTVHRVMGHKETLSGRQLDKVRYLSNKMSGVIVTFFPFNTFHSCFKCIISWHTYYVLLESSTLSLPT